MSSSEDDTIIGSVSQLYLRQKESGKFFENLSCWQSLRKATLQNCTLSALHSIMEESRELQELVLKGRFLHHKGVQVYKMELNCSRELKLLDGSLLEA